jgi:hypothetical protein|tara:strand:- start:58 stop:369 length:312 start_codon:yes stop_codon:yes gene_type:complete
MGFSAVIPICSNASAGRPQLLPPQFHSICHLSQSEFCRKARVPAASTRAFSASGQASQRKVYLCQRKVYLCQRKVYLWQRKVYLWQRKFYLGQPELKPDQLEY